MWRPANWKNPYVASPLLMDSLMMNAYEKGANAMLKAVKAELFKQTSVRTHITIGEAIAYGLEEILNRLEELSPDTPELPEKVGIPS